MADGAEVEAVDVVVVGSGPAACSLVFGLLKDRSDGSLTVAMLESGPAQTEAPQIHAPVLMSTLFDPELNVHRTIAAKLPTGKDTPVTCAHVLGGGSAVNFMHYSRGGKDDYDAWPEGWQFKDLEPHFAKVESFSTPDAALAATRASGGPIQVCHGRKPLPLTQESLRAAEAFGVPIRKDMQDFKTAHGMEAAAKIVDPKTGQRSDAYTKMIKPLEASHADSLKVYTHALVDTVIFDDQNRATGCRFIHRGEPKTITARKLVVLAAGTLGTPCILERSGVGDPKVLDAAGVKQHRLDLPGVGTNYQDHQIAPLFYLAKHGVRPASSYLDDSTPEQMQKDLAIFLEKGLFDDRFSANCCEVVGKLRPTDAEIEGFGASAPAVKGLLDGKPTRSLLGMIVLDGTFVPPDPNDRPLHRYSAYPYLLHPLARGTMHIKSPSPSQSGTLETGFMKDEADVDALLWGYRIVDSICRNVPFFERPVAARHPKSQSEEDVKAFLRENIVTCWHAIGTCAMKPRDERGVVDTFLNVHGTQRLKVADLSILPSNISAHPVMTALAVGSRASELINEELKSL